MRINASLICLCLGLTAAFALSTSPSQAEAFTDAATDLETPSSADWIGSVDPRSNPNSPFGIVPSPEQDSSLLISRPEYLLSWNPSLRTINWASWILTAADMGRVGRSGYKLDKELEVRISKNGLHAVDPLEYSTSCLDIGHQVPSGDRNASFKSNVAVFSMSNMLPQTAYLNRILWENLEAETRALALKSPKNRFLIMAGPIFHSDLKYIGTHSDIAFPTANFKTVIDLGPSQTSQPKLFAAVIMPNVTSKGTDPIDDRETTCMEKQGLPSMKSPPWQDYSVKLETIEKASGIDLSVLRGRLAQ